MLLFDCWFSSCKADDLKSVRELMLLEELKNCLPDRIVVYLNESKGGHSTAGCVLGR